MDLVTKLDVTNPDVQNRVLAMQQSLAAKGQDPHAAYQALDFAVITSGRAVLHDGFLYI